MKPYFTIDQQIKTIEAVTPIQVTIIAKSGKEPAIEVIIDLDEYKKEFRKEMSIEAIKLESGYNLIFFNQYQEACCKAHLLRKIMRTKEFKTLITDILIIKQHAN